MDLSVAKKPLCRICNETAYRDHLNYGAISCYSCRAFFRRIHKVSAEKPWFFCKFGGNCEINLSTRRKCKKCRYDLCVKAGMQAKSVLKESERVSRFKNSFYKNKRLTGGTTEAEPKEDEGGEEQEEDRSFLNTQPPKPSPSPLPPCSSSSSSSFSCTPEAILERILSLKCKPSGGGGEVLYNGECPCLCPSMRSEGLANRVQYYQAKSLEDVSAAWRDAFRDFKWCPEFVVNLVRTQEDREELSSTRFRQHLSQLSGLFVRFARRLTCFQVS